MRTSSSLLLTLAAALFLQSCSGLAYLAETGVGQWKLFNRARPVQEVLDSPRTTEKVRHAILLVQEAKAFAVKLGLRATTNYSSFVPLDAPCVVWAVSAANPLVLEEKKWHFPIVGAVPYLGFFKKESAENEARRLQKEEQPTPDTWVRCVPAYSSLGWFSDPLYSSMLLNKDRDIAELVIHESLHATVWVKSTVDFNEKLANFVGLEGSLRFMGQTRGADALAEAKREVVGEKLFGDFLHGQVEAYKQSVSTPEAKKEFYEQLRKRYEFFLARAKESGPPFQPLDIKFKDWNNAALLAYANYYSDFSTFERMLQACEGDLGRFVHWIASEQEKDAGRFKSAPEEHLVDLVKGSSGCPAAPAR